jgi:hypothetical protein
MIKEIDGSFQDKNSELLKDIYLPAKNKADIENSKPFKILKENKQDVTELFTGQKNEMLEPITMKKYQEKDKESNAKFYLNSIKEIGNNLFDFVDQSFAGDIYNLTASGMKMSTTLNPDKIKEEMEGNQIPPPFGILANNIGEFGVNLLPVMDKLIDFMGKPPGPDGKIPDVFNNDEKLMEWSGEKVKYFKDNRAKFKAIQDDANMASQFANLVVQDSMVSIPLYEGLTKAGVPKIWATVLGFGMGSAIALEDKLFGAESTFIQEFGKEEVNAFKKILSIIPDTPIDAIADEVIQTFEYTAFAFAIGPIIQAAKFMKTNLPSFAVGGAVAGAIEGQDPNIEEPTQEFNLGIDQGKKKSEINLDDQSAVPGTVNQYGFEKTASLKALVNAVIPKKTPVFNSAVKQAVENIAEKGTGDQILGSIKNVPGVKANEIKWIGLDTFLEGKKSVTKKEVIDFVEANRLDVNEARFGDFEDSVNTAKPKTIAEMSDDDIRKTQDRIYEDAETTNRDELRFVAQHLDYLKAADNKRIDNFPIKKTVYQEGYDTPDITDQNYNFQNFMSDFNLYGAVKGLDDDFGSAIGQNYFDTTFGEHYLIHAIKSKSTKNLLTDKMEKQLYYNFSTQTTLPDEMVRNADVNNGFHVQSDEFENFKKYLDDNGAYISNHIRYEIPKDQRVAVFNEMNIRSNEEMYYQDGGDNITEAVGEYANTGLKNKGKFGEYTEPGGENYSELIFTLSKGGENVGAQFPLQTGVTKQATMKNTEIRTSPHMGVAGEIAHVRFKSRMNGNMKVLSVEEMQSDLVQGVKKYNEQALDNQRTKLLSKESVRQQKANSFENVSEDQLQKILKDNPPDELIKDFPFKNNWYELVIKRLIRYAADNGFDAISIPKASVIQDRYNLTKRVDNFNITYFDDMRKEVGLMARDQNGVTQIDDIYTFDRIEKEFGKDVLNKVIKKGPKVNDEISGTKGKLKKSDLPKIIQNEEYPIIKLDKKIEIGGEGKSNLYNKAIPSFIKKYGKKWNAKVYDDNIKVDSTVPMDIIGYAKDKFEKNIPVTIFEITPSMKKSVKEEGQSLFEILGIGGAGAVGAKAVSDSQRNNTISNLTQ